MTTPPVTTAQPTASPQPAAVAKKAELTNDQRQQLVVALGEHCPAIRAAMRISNQLHIADTFILTPELQSTITAHAAATAADAIALTLVNSGMLSNNAPRDYRVRAAVDACTR